MSLRPEFRKVWNLGASTGFSTLVDPRTANQVDILDMTGMSREMNVYIRTAANSTASVEMVTAMSTAHFTSTGPWVTLGSSQALSSNQCVVIGFTGPFLYVAPRLIAITSTLSTGVTVELVAN